jgi:hypothetical protein
MTSISANLSNCGLADSLFEHPVETIKLLASWKVTAESKAEKKKVRSLLNLNLDLSLFLRLPPATET